MVNLVARVLAHVLPDCCQQMCCLVLHRCNQIILLHLHMHPIKMLDNSLTSPGYPIRCQRQPASVSLQSFSGLTLVSLTRIERTVSAACVSSSPTVSTSWYSDRKAILDSSRMLLGYVALNSMFWRPSLGGSMRTSFSISCLHTHGSRLSNQQVLKPSNAPRKCCPLRDCIKSLEILDGTGVNGRSPETHVQQPVCLIQDKHAKIAEERAQCLCVLQMVQETPRSCHLYTQWNHKEAYRWSVLI